MQEGYRDEMLALCGAIKPGSFVVLAHGLGTYFSIVKDVTANAGRPVHDYYSVMPGVETPHTFRHSRGARRVVGTHGMEQGQALPGQVGARRRVG